MWHGCISLDTIISFYFESTAQDDVTKKAQNNLSTGEIAFLKQKEVNRVG